MRWIAIILVSGFMSGCLEERGIESIDPIEPREENHSPVIASRSDTFAVIGDTLRLEFYATDQDGDPLRFKQEMPCTWGEVQSGQCHPPIAHIDSRTGSFCLIPEHMMSRSGTSL